MPHNSGSGSNIKPNTKPSPSFLALARANSAGKIERSATMTKPTPFPRADTFTIGIQQSTESSNEERILIELHDIEKDLCGNPSFSSTATILLSPSSVSANEDTDYLTTDKKKLYRLSMLAKERIQNKEFTDSEAPSVWCGLITDDDLLPLSFSHTNNENTSSPSGAGFAPKRGIPEPPPRHFVHQQSSESFAGHARRTAKPLPPLPTDPAARRRAATLSTLGVNALESHTASKSIYSESRRHENEENEIQYAAGSTDLPVAYPGAEPVVKNGILWSWLGRVVGVVLDRQAQQNLEHTLRLLNGLFRDRKTSKSIDALLALSLIALYYKATPFRTYSIETDVLPMKNSVHYFKFAAAAYGWKMLNPLMFSDKRASVLAQGFAKGDAINDAALCQHCGVEPSDIIATKWTSSDYQPAHFIAIDHATRAIVLSIRGTFHVKDALTDLVASASPFLNGYGHTGMVECATRKLDQIRPVLMAALEEYKYKLVVVGHSLGAGTASLITLMLHEEIPNQDMHCYAYAPPCVVSPNLALTCSDFITSFCLGDDCVPRLSYGSLFRLKKLTSKIMNRGDMKKRFVQATWASATGKGEENQRIDADLKEISLEVGASLDDKLLPPGNIYQILRQNKSTSPSSSLTSQPSSGKSYRQKSSVSRREKKKKVIDPNDDNSPPHPSSPDRSSDRISVGSPSMPAEFGPLDAQKLYGSDPNQPPMSILLAEDTTAEEDLYIMEKSNPTLFCDVIVSANMFTDHLPWKYFQAFDSIWKANIERWHSGSERRLRSHTESIRNSVIRSAGISDVPTSSSPSSSRVPPSSPSRPSISSLKQEQTHR